MKVSTAPVTGMREFLPATYALRQYVKTTIEETYHQFGFHQVETPMMESIALLNSGQGGENQKMIFKVLKRGEKLDLTTPPKSEDDLVDYGMRFDLTLPLARFYANNRAQLPLPCKVIQMGYVWRAERPQKGRYRQLWQCDIDIIGAKAIAVEIELIYVTALALLKLGFQNFTVRINDRTILEKLVLACGFQPENTDQVLISLDKLDKIGLQGVEAELVSQAFSAGAIAALLETIAAFQAGKLTLATLSAAIPTIDKQVIDDLQSIIAAVVKLSGGHYNIAFDLSLVRGMGYYTGPIFEIATAGFSSSIAGGGRYDKMIGRFLNGQPVPACGFSIGFERIVYLLEEMNFQPPKAERKVAFMFNAKEDHDITALFTSAEQWRKEGWVVSVEIKQRNLKDQLDRLKAIGYTHFAVYNAGSALEPKPLL
ncbi:MAG: histidine--tRNA ligase [Caldilinea sp. CFX5]|nr:histidine--tRNA ligase [Caldilinea sp. CFX5]